MQRTLFVSLLALLSFTAACANDGTEADRVGVGAQCVGTQSCPEVDFEGDAGRRQLQCLTSWRGGYCGLENCANSLECPEGSLCVAHDDPVGSYCFRTCIDKADCNRNRDAANEANCNGTGTYDLQDPSETKSQKVCIPPSGT